MPGPSSITCERVPPSPPGAERDQRAGGAYFAALSSRLNSTCSNSTSSRSSIGKIRLQIEPASDARPGSSWRAASALPITSARSIRPVRSLQRSGLEPRHVQQIADEAVEPLGFVLDGPDQIELALRRIQRLALRRQAGRRAQDRRKRRAQVVRDRRQQRRAQPLGLGRRAAPDRRPRRD